jgi:hypothetical protein
MPLGYCRPYRWQSKLWPALQAFGNAQLVLAIPPTPTLSA